MKIVKIVILIFIIVLAIVVYLQYPKLNMISGYAAKNMATNVFYAKRPIDSINANDNNVPLIKLAKTKVDLKKKIVSSSVFGLLERKALYRDGVGAVLIDDEYDTKQEFLQPKRTVLDNKLPFPYGNEEPIDTILKNINYKILNEAIENAFNEDRRPQLKKTRSVIVVHKDQIVAEKYAPGFDKNSKFIGWSMAKSLMSSFMGVLVKEKNFDIQEPIVNLINHTNWETDKKANITTHHLLKMTSGLDWEEDYTKISDVTKMLFLERNMVSSQLNNAATFQPGENFIYSSGTSNVLSGILRSQFKTHQEYLDFPYTHFIDKIGMNSMLLETDMEGNYIASSYAWATARDWAKYGLLHLHKGNWNGEQIFSKSWSEYTATPTQASNNEYGAQFWTNTEGFLPDAPRDMYYADGYHGQRVFIIPSLDLVIVRTGLTHEGRTDSYDVMNTLVRDIIAAFK